MKGELEVKIPFFQWDIDLEEFNGATVGDKLLSPAFYTHYSENSKHKWQISLYPNGEHESDEDCLKFFLIHLGNIGISASYTFSILDNNSVRVNHSEGFIKNFFGVKSRHNGLPYKWAYQTSIRKSFIQNKRNNALKNNQLAVVCNIVVEMGYDEELSLFQESIQEEIPSKTFKELEKYEKMLENQKFSDVTIIAEGNSYYLHKCILASSSVVFDAMFTNDMKEKNENLVKIEDIKKEVLDEFFRFIYSGKVKDIQNFAGDLLIAAEKYSVEGLKTLCEETMANLITSSTAIEYLQLSIMNNAEKLKTYVIKWLAKNFEKEMIAKDNLDSLWNQRPEIFLEIMKRKFYMGKYLR